MSTLLAPKSKIMVYPESDGQPMAENTRQYWEINRIVNGLDREFQNDETVFVAGDLFWYPVEGHPEIRTAPDAMVAFGRPKGHRSSYMQWVEGGIAPQVTFEVLSPGNRPGMIVEKFRFFDEYGVEEYYVYDPDEVTLDGWLRRDGKLRQIADMNGHVSPRLGIRFEITDGELVLFHKNGEHFLTFRELEAHWQQERQRAELAERTAASEKQAREQAEILVEQLRAQLRERGVSASEDTSNS
jgi:Uma2 family endonuclease